MLRSTLFNIAVFGGTALALVAFAPALLGPPAAARRRIRWWVDCIFRLQRTVLGLDFEFRGLDRLPEGPFVVASAHQSAWDTIAFFAALDDPAYLVKKEIARIPLFASWLRALGAVVVDRAGGTAATRRTLRGAAAALAAGRPVVIFPSGTRTDPSADVEIRPGVAAIYRHCGVPVVPVSLDSGRYWKRRAFVKEPGTISVEFGPPIAPGLDGPAFTGVLAERIASGNRRLLVK